MMKTSPFGRFKVLTVLLLISALITSPALAVMPPISYDWHTFYGNVFYPDEIRASGVDANGNIYLAGISLDTWSGPGGQLPLNPHIGNKNIVVLKLSKTGGYLWHTFYGCGATTMLHDIYVDASGNVFITGDSQLSFNGPSGQDPLNSYTNNFDLFAMKLNTNGAYQWHTFYGAASDSDTGYGITVDNGGNVIVAGESGEGWHGPSNVAPLNSFSGTNSNITAIKLNPNGEYIWHTFYGSTNEGDRAFGVTTDSQNNIYLTGASYESWNGPLAESPINAKSNDDDIFVLGLTSDGAYSWHGFYGGDSIDEGRKIAADTGGNLYVAGRSNTGWDFPSGPTAPLHAYTEGDEIVVLKLKVASPYSYDWHTFYGSEINDYAYGMQLQGESLFITGTSAASWNGDSDAPPLYAYTGGQDINMLALTTNGMYQWHTFFGSSVDDEGHGISVDANKNIILAGYSKASWTGPSGKSPLNAYHGDSDHIVIKLVHRLSQTFTSNKSQDGWILESSENSGTGGIMNTSGSTFNLGDDAQNRQYRCILSFDTKALPDSAVITKVILRFKKAGSIGSGNPISVLKGFAVDIKKGVLGTSALALGDFKAAVNKSYKVTPSISGAWHTINLTTAKSYINKIGFTQIRIRFNLDDNNNFAANVLKIYSGNAVSASRPQLLVEYYVP